jgi:hypothetical protein
MVINFERIVSLALSARLRVSAANGSAGCDCCATFIPGRMPFSPLTCSLQIDAPKLITFSPVLRVLHFIHYLAYLQNPKAFKLPTQIFFREKMQPFPW